MNRHKIPILLLLISNLFLHSAIAQENLLLQNENVKIQWDMRQGVWKMNNFRAKVYDKFTPFGVSSCEYGLIYSKDKPDTTPIPILNGNDTLDFPENTFRLVKPDFQRATSSVPMNKAGSYFKFYPSVAYSSGDTIIFQKQTMYGNYQAKWFLDKNYPSDIHLQISLKANVEGYYSLPVPTISTIQESNLEWAVVPGYFQGKSIQKSFPLAYAYAQGLPEYPVLCRESTITTMSSLMTNKDGITMAVIPEPGQDRNPYEKDESTHVKHWKIALSHKNRDSELTPMAYHPVLGEVGSFVKKDEVIKFNVQISLQHASWYDVYKHTIYDVYNLSNSLSLRENKKSLVDRLFRQYDYVLDDKTALWNEEEYEGQKIIAQSYQASIVGADNDAMKNSDIGAVWMLAKITNDGVFNKRRIPFIRNFKILQQVQDGFFKGAVGGQYYLSKSKRFTEEWGSHFEPIAITYYTMADLGNILLFEPDNEQIKLLLKNGADKLMEWQQKDGSWFVAYDRNTHTPIYTDLKDLRPTFYGLIIAYKVLGESKYLEAAIKGADWLIENSIEEGHFLGVCGDVRFVNDFATAQIAGAMLDLYEMSSDEKYLDAAVKTARMYTTSIYTHPIPSRSKKHINDKVFEDWQLSQIGLNFEHGGTMGSAVNSGPILLTSHCALFLKLYQITKDEMFRDFARLGALGKDAFVNADTGVASYYWNRFDHGAGQFPHHAWWQIGWIYDYLVAEAELRSDGKIRFPRGFMTPKVGPHKTVGFDSGFIEGQKADLILRKGLVEIDEPNIDYITALSTDKKTLFVILLNNQAKENKFRYAVNVSSIKQGIEIKKGTENIKSFDYQVLKIKL